MFRWYTNEFKYNLRDKLYITDVIDIFTCEDIISSHVRISYRFYQFVTTRYTTDFYIIKKLIASNMVSVNFLASENWCRRVHFESHLPERRVLSKFSAPHPSPPSWWTSAWLPMRIMREPGYDFNNKKMAESFTEYNMEFGFTILKKHVVVICWKHFIYLIMSRSKVEKSTKKGSLAYVQTSLQKMAELDEISRVQSHFSPHFLLIFLIYLARALAILCKLACKREWILFQDG